MTAPERIWAFHAPEIAEDNPQCSIVAGEHVMHGAQDYTRTDIHQAALDRIAELEGAMGEIVAEGIKVQDSSHAVWRLVETITATARAVLAKGDDDENPMCDDCGSRIGREGCKCPVAKGDG